MHEHARHFDLNGWKKRFNVQLETFFGLRDRRAELQDSLVQIQARLANQEILLQQLVAAMPHLSRDTPATPSQGPPVYEFSDIKKPPVINGSTKPKLTQTQHDILMELLMAGPGGLSLEELDGKSEHPEARKTLKKLARDADWENVIVFPGKKGQGGYRLRFS